MEAPARCLFCTALVEINDQKTNSAKRFFCRYGGCYAKYAYYEQQVRQAHENLMINYPKKLARLHRIYMQYMKTEEWDERCIEIARIMLFKNNKQGIMNLQKMFIEESKKIVVQIK